MSHATTPVARGLDALIAAQTRLLVRALPPAVGGDAEAVHRCRVASRRLREMLPLAGMAAPRESTRALRRDLRRITRRLGRVRELDVTLEVFAEESRAYATAAGTSATLVRAWSRERERALRAASQKLARLDVRQLRGALVAVARALSDQPPDPWVRAIEARVRRRAAALAHDLTRLGSLYVPERLHAVRIASKKLRYSLEAGRDTLGSKWVREIHELTGAQDLLGEWHDLHVVQARVQAVSQTRRDTAARATAALMQQCDADCRVRHARFLSIVPQLVTLCHQLRTGVAARKMLRMSSPASARRVPAARRA